LTLHSIDRMTVEDEGEGDAVVCVHGLGGTSNTFTALMPVLGRHRVLRVDLPGSGRSQHAEGALSIERFAGAVQGAGLGLIFVPLNTLAFATLSPALRTDASGFYMLLRNIGGSIGISLTVNVLARQTQIAHADLGAGLTPYTLPWANADIAHTLGVDAVVSMLDAAVNRQAAMIAYIDVFRLMFWITVAVMPLLLLLRKPKGPGEAVHLAD
jgi:hypothetical protein